MQKLSTEQRRAMLARLLLEQAAQPERIPLSFNQERLWFLHQLEPRSPVYNQAFGVRLTGTPDRQVLQRALTAIVERHETLRTTFAHTNDGPSQIIKDPRPLEIAVADLSGLPEESREIELNRFLEDEARLRFDLKRGPLFRVKLFRLADREHVLFINLHHIVSDGWSVGIFFRELRALYEAFADGKPAPLSELPIQYADFAAWQREHFSGRQIEGQLAWWKQQLAGDCPPLELPTDHARPAIQSFNGACEPFALPVPLADSLKRIAQREGATLFMVVLAAFQSWLHRYTGQDEIAVGTPVAGRNRAELEELIGFFANTLVLRVSLRGNPTF